MNRIRQQLAIATNWPVLLAVGVLSSLGVISIWADSPVDGKKQLVFLVVAIGCMALFQAIDYRVIGRLSVPFYLFSMSLVLYTVLGKMAEKHGHPLPFVHTIKGACNWINFGPASLQPAELMKYTGHERDLLAK